jgi:hypothetical protein
MPAFHPVPTFWSNLAKVSCGGKTGHGRASLYLLTRMACLRPSQPTSAIPAARSARRGVRPRSAVRRRAKLPDPGREDEALEIGNDIGIGQPQTTGTAATSQFFRNLLMFTSGLRPASHYKRLKILLRCRPAGVATLNSVKGAPWDVTRNARLPISEAAIIRANSG